MTRHISVMTTLSIALIAGILYATRLSAIAAIAAGVFAALIIPELMKFAWCQAKGVRFTMTWFGPLLGFVAPSFVSDDDLDNLIREANSLDLGTFDPAEIEGVASLQARVRAIPDTRAIELARYAVLLVMGLAALVALRLAGLGFESLDDFFRIAPVSGVLLAAHAFVVCAVLVGGALFVSAASGWFASILAASIYRSRFEEPRTLSEAKAAGVAQARSSFREWSLSSAMDGTLCVALTALFVSGKPLAWEALAVLFGLRTFVYFVLSASVVYAIRSTPPA